MKNMKNENKKRLAKLGAVLLIFTWLGLAISGILLPDKDISVAERRPLKKLPNISVSTLLDGSFMRDFEGYVLDQFPLRDQFRTLKSTFHYYGLSQKDNNGIYMDKGYAAKMDYTLKPTSISYAAGKFQYIYDTYLRDSSGNIVFATIPDKSLYMAQNGGHLNIDYKELYTLIASKTPWAKHLDLSDALSLDDFYKTDSHWRQEKIFPAANAIADALKVKGPAEKDFAKETLNQPFYGVYYGQGALPMKGEKITLMKNHLLENCRVYDYESGKYREIYSMEKAAGKDMYEVYLGGARALLTMEMDACPENLGKELIVFRDSFGSSIVPLLAGSYEKITLVDIRYISSNMLGQIMDFHGQDVLFLYSSGLLNGSSVLK